MSELLAEPRTDTTSHHAGGRRESVDRAAAQSSSKPDKGKQETCKLLSHLLDQLRRTTDSAPTLFGPPPPQAKGKSRAVESDSDDDGVDEGLRRARQAGRVDTGMDWAEKTFELMGQLRDVLAVSDKKGWNLFSNRSVAVPSSVLCCC